MLASLAPGRSEHSVGRTGTSLTVWRQSGPLLQGRQQRLRQVSGDLLPQHHQGGSGPRDNFLQGGGRSSLQRCLLPLLARLHQHAYTLRLREGNGLAGAGDDTVPALGADRPIDLSPTVDQPDRLDRANLNAASASGALGSFDLYPHSQPLSTLRCIPKWHSPRSRTVGRPFHSTNITLNMYICTSLGPASPVNRYMGI